MDRYSYYLRVVEVARRLRDPAWVAYHCQGSTSAATDRLALRFGFEGRETLMLVLCAVLLGRPDQESFDREVANLFDRLRPPAADAGTGPGRVLPAYYLDW